MMKSVAKYRPLLHQLTRQVESGGSVLGGSKLSDPFQFQKSVTAHSSIASLLLHLHLIAFTLYTSNKSKHVQLIIISVELTSRIILPPSIQHDPNNSQKSSVILVLFISSSSHSDPIWCSPRCSRSCKGIKACREWLCLRYSRSQTVPVTDFHSASANGSRCGIHKGWDIRKRS